MSHNANSILYVRTCAAAMGIYACKPVLVTNGDTANHNIVQVFIYPSVRVAAYARVAFKYIVVWRWFLGRGRP